MSCTQEVWGVFVGAVSGLASYLLLVYGVLSYTRF